MYVISFRWRDSRRVMPLLRTLLDKTSGKPARAAAEREESRSDKGPPALHNEPDGPRGMRPSQN